MGVGGMSEMSSSRRGAVAERHRICGAVREKLGLNERVELLAARVSGRKALETLVTDAIMNN